MLDNSTIHLTPQQHEQIRAIAVARGVSVEEAALLLAKTVIKARFLLPTQQGKVVPIRALNGATSDD